ncbi:hypothetical protein [Burkholderia gladioli]|uniref:hypothetical protein n=1 Tax=Burkholderia gladioli TaxID=28095 RepID=UPI0016403E23|nr:hypothetical protein [Burkholderia gladioli]
MPIGLSVAIDRAFRGWYGDGRHHMGIEAVLFNVFVTFLVKIALGRAGRSAWAAAGVHHPAPVAGMEPATEDKPGCGWPNLLAFPYRASGRASACRPCMACRARAGGPGWCRPRTHVTKSTYDAEIFKREAR